MVTVAISDRARKALKDRGAHVESVGNGEHAVTFKKGGLSPAVREQIARTEASAQKRRGRDGDPRSTAEMMAQVKRKGIKNFRILRRREMLAILTHPEQADKIVQKRVGEFNALYRKKEVGHAN